MKNLDFDSISIPPLLLAILFALNIFIVVLFQLLFVFTISVPDTEILRANGSHDPDFSDVSFFSDIEILDSMGWIFEEIVLYKNEDGTFEVVRLKQNILFNHQYALDKSSITTVPDGENATVVIRNFLGKDEIVVKNQSEILSIKGHWFYRNENTILFIVFLHFFCSYWNVLLPSSIKMPLMQRTARHSVRDWGDAS